MANRTYLIGLYWAAYALYRYMSRWQNKAEPHMSAPQLACFNATLEAVTECVQLFTPDPPTS